MSTQHGTHLEPPLPDFTNSNYDSDTTDYSDFDECPICMTLGDENEVYWLFECNHYFCTTCLVKYLETHISEGNVLKIKCPQDGCDRLLADSLLEKILDKPTFEKYQQAFLQKVHNKNSKVKFCPKSGCSKPFTPDMRQPFTICSCEAEICHVCCNFRHEGRNCFEALDRDFELFAQENDVKFCVMCKTVVQKVEGCVHITCPICDYEWCWLCGQEHTEQHAWNCKRIWDPLPPANIIKEAMKIEPEPWKTRAKTAFKSIGWFMLQLPLRILFWPFFKFFFRGENLGRNQPFDEKVILAILSFFFCFMYDGLVGEVVALMIRFPDKWMFLGGCLFFLLIVPWVSEIYKKLAKKTIQGRWASRNSTIFQYTDKAKPIEQQPENFVQGTHQAAHNLMINLAPMQMRENEQQQQAFETSSMAYNEKSQMGLMKDYHQTNLSMIETNYTTSEN